MTKPQDVLVGLALCNDALRDASYAHLAAVLGMSGSEVHASVRRLHAARLLEAESRVVRRRPFVEFILYGVPYAYPAALGESTRGVPTAWAAPAMGKVVASKLAETPVWPDPEGTQPGLAVEPLYRSVPMAAQRNQDLYAVLAWVDAVRLGRVRERTAAARAIEEHLMRHG